MVLLRKKVLGVMYMYVNFNVNCFLKKKKGFFFWFLINFVDWILRCFNIFIGIGKVCCVV